MKKSILLTGLGLIVATPLLAQQMMGQDSTKATAPMKRTDVEAQVKSHFSMLDADKDGVVTREEMAARHAAQMKDMQDKMFSSIDTNQDQSISRAEFDAHHASMMKAGPMGHAMPMKPKGQADAAATPSAAVPGAMLGHAGHTRADKGAMGDRTMRMGTDWMFTTADLNKDGKVTQDEANKAALARFDRADSNKDGMISVEERRAERAKRRAMKTDKRARSQ